MTRRYRFHLIGSQPIDLEVAAGSIGELGEMLYRERFITGHLAEADNDGVMPAVLVASARVQCVIEVG